MSTLAPSANRCFSSPMGLFDDTGTALFGEATTAFAALSNYYITKTGENGTRGCDSGHGNPARLPGKTETMKSYVSITILLKTVGISLKF